MKANELRIGNKLQKDNGDIFTVLRLDDTYDILVCEQRGLLTLDYNLFGILLTEEWLLKAGFEKKVRHDFEGCKKIPVFALYSFSITIWDDGHFFHDWIGGNIEIKYVHQLQNLYFALTRQELEFKLK